MKNIDFAVVNTRYLGWIIGLMIYYGVNAQVNHEVELFQIERSRDANKIYYEVNLDQDGTLNDKEPIMIYWIKHEEEGQKTPLTWIQTRLAYGLEYLEINKEAAEFRFVSYKDRKLFLRKVDNNYAVFVASEEGEVILQKVFVKLVGNSFFFPSIPYVDLYGSDPITHQQIKETIKP